MLIEITWENCNPLAAADYRIYRNATDLSGVLAVINDIYDRHPEKFGSEKIREALKKDLAKHLQGGILQRKSSVLKDEFYQYFAKRLDHYGLHPFDDTSLTFVAGWAHGTSTLEAAEPLLKRFQRFQNLKEILTTGNALNLVNRERADYVVTGNVVNNPDNTDTTDTMLACANMAKKGGRVIHLLSYGEDILRHVIDDEKLHELAGQKHLHNEPAGPYNGLLGMTKLMMLEQLREVEHSTEVSASYQKAKQKNPGMVISDNRFYSTGAVSEKSNEIKKR